MAHSNLIFENVKITFVNFAGRERPPYNAEGQRNFAICIEDEEFAKKLKHDGWNVRFAEPKIDPDTGMEIYYPPTLKVNIGYGDNPAYHPRIMMEQGGSQVYLDKESIGMLDTMNIINVRGVEVRPYEWEPGKFSGWLKSLRIEVAPDIFCD